ncbi:MAG: sensor histidine kinase [Thermomicrobiales bacterium]
MGRRRVSFPWRSLRLRLTLWYVALLAIILLTFSGILAVRLNISLRDSLDDTLRNRADFIAGAVTRDNGVLRLDGALIPSDRNQGEQFVRLCDATCSPVSDTVAPNAIPSLPGDVAAARQGATTIHSVTTGEIHLRVLTQPLPSGAGGVLQIGLSEDDIRETLRTLLLILATLTPAMLLIASGGGLFLAGRALAPVDRITRAAQAIEATGLHERLPEPPTGDEIGRLAQTLNALIARLEAAFARQRQFTADASHELRTPLTIMGGEVDVTLRHDRTTEEYRETLAGVRDEVTHMQVLVADLLLLARDDTTPPLPPTVIDLAGVASAVTEQLRPLAATRGQTIALHTTPAPVRGDADDLARLARNILENAIRYTPRQGAITVTVRRDGAMAAMAVADSGPGIAAAALPHLFDRFYRADPGRNRAAGGTGLGLAIAQAIAHRHGGAISVTSAAGEGSTFTLMLPLAFPVAASTPLDEEPG